MQWINLAEVCIGLCLSMFWSSGLRGILEGDWAREKLQTETALRLRILVRSTPDIRDGQYIYVSSLVSIGQWPAVGITVCLGSMYDSGRGL